MLLPGAIFELKMHQNAFAAGADPSGELTVLPHTPSCFSGARFMAGESRRGKGRKERVGEEGEGAFPNSFFYNLTSE